MFMKLISLLHVDFMTASQHLRNMSLLDDMFIRDTETEIYFDCHFHANSVKVDGEWTLRKPGDEMGFQAFDTCTVDKSLYITLRHCF